MNVKKTKIASLSTLSRLIIPILSVGFGCLIIMYGIVCWIIFSEVKEIRNDTMQTYNGEVVEAGIRLLQSDKHSYIEKNRVIWALGQIGDAKALPVLEQLRTDKSCEEPCRKDTTICQYGLGKAVKSCKGAFSITKWMYRFL